MVGVLEADLAWALLPFAVYFTEHLAIVFEGCQRPAAIPDVQVTFIATSKPVQVFLGPSYFSLH